MSNYEEVGNISPSWNCIWTGTKKKENIVKLEAGDKSFCEGYYVKTSEREMNGKPVKVHSIRVIAVGDPAHLSVDSIPEGGVACDVIGQFVLNKKIAEELQGGEKIKIQWMGKVNSKSGGSSYHNWLLYIDHSAEPLNVTNGIEIAEGDGATAGETGSKGPAETFVAEGDDDLPF